MKRGLIFMLCLLSIKLVAQECGFDAMHQKMMASDPAYKAKVEEMKTRWAESQRAQSKVSTVGTNTYGKVYEIPVVVHVIHTGGAVGTAYNPSDSTIQASINYLNETYAATYSSYPNASSGGTYFPVKFVLAKRDPSCNYTNGINRVNGSSVTNYTSGGVNAGSGTGASQITVKFLSRWDSRTYYNIWIVNKIDGNDGTSGSFTAGFASLPGTGFALDGTMMLASQLGAGKVTLPHEIGHAFGLLHTFQGDAGGSTCPTNTNCATQGDLVCDTEPHKRALGSCASGTTNTCVSATYSDNAAKNIMNYSTCSDRLTAGQRDYFLHNLIHYRLSLAGSLGTVDTSLNVVSASCTTTTTNSLYSNVNMGPIYVKLNDLEYKSAGTDNDFYSYSDFSCRLVAHITQGESYTLSLATYKNAQKIAAYIDYNGDGAFASSERVAYFTPVNYGTVSDTDWHTMTYTVPSTGINTCAPLRMRVLSVFGNNSIPTNACGALQWSQSEDFAVIVKPAATASTATIVSHPICSSGGNTVFKVDTTGSFSGISYQWYKNYTAVGTDSNKYYASGLTNGDKIQVKVNYTDICSDDSVFSSIYTVATQTDTNAWVGGTSTAITTTSNWSCGSLPTTSQSVLIDGDRMVNAPATVTGVLNSKNCWINNGASLTVGGTLSVGGDLTVGDNATLDMSSGFLALTGSSAQTLNLGETGHKIVTVEDMELDNSAGASFGYGIIDVRRDYIPTAGTLTSNNRLRLVGNATYKGRIAQGSSSGGYITGNIVARLYIPGGKRAFRFLAHSAPDTKPLSGITDNIDITGSGGSTNGFTTTQSNYPSAFYFDVDSADNSTAGNNPGWQAFTAANVNNWYKGQVMRVLVRGAKGQGLTGGNYTPSAATLGMNQQVNQGDQTVILTKGANTNFVLVGNPFPSQVQLNTVARGSNVGANFYIWNPNQGVKGAYTSHQFSTSYILPQWGAFVTTVSGNTNNTMVFEEADKTNATPATQFKTTASNYLLKLSIDDTAHSWDKLLINFDDDGYAVQDQLDAVKLNNPGLDFYTVSQNGTDLSIDVRPSRDKEVIPVGVDVWHYGGSGMFTVTTEDINLPTGVTLIFHDKYLNKQVPITDTFSYTFTVDKADSSSGGKNRFEIGVSDKSTGIVANAEGSNVQVYPNPVNGLLHIAYKHLVGKTTIAYMI